VGDKDSLLQTLINIQSLVSGVDASLGIGGDVLESLITAAREQGAATEFPKAKPTGRRAAIAAQKERKNAQT